MANAGVQTPSAASSGTVRAPMAVAAIGLSAPVAVAGGLILTNEELCLRFPHLTSDGILDRTGVRTRHRVAEGQTLLDMTTEAASLALQRSKLSVHDLDLILCCTSTPPQTSPSLACLVGAQLGSYTNLHAVAPAFDLSAACAGFLYGLSTAFDFLYSRPTSRVLVLTAEAMSSVVDPNDFGTASLFSDASTATIVHGSAVAEEASIHLYRPLLFSKPDERTSLTIPGPCSGQFLKMDGRKVFNEAVRCLLEVLDNACQDAGIITEQLNWVLPHQASGRIIAALRNRLPSGPKVIDDIAENGNTSSSTIPLSLSRAMHMFRPGERIAICAFGAGFTYGGAVLEVV